MLEELDGYEEYVRRADWLTNLSRTQISQTNGIKTVQICGNRR